MTRLLPTLVLLPLLLAATPDSATYRNDTSDFLYFLVISDSHLDAPADSGKEATENLHWATSVLVDTVLPDFMVNGGDLTDATGGGLIPLGQQNMEWEAYQTIVDANGMTADFYYDLPGNHDHYLDAKLQHYLDYSVQGRFDGKTNHAWTMDEADSKYHFVAVASAASDGLPFPEDNVGLDETDLEFLAETLELHADADILTIFSHHPAAYYFDAKDAIYDAMSDHGATAFVHGHTHDQSITWQQGTLHIEVSSLGKSSAGQVGLVAYDGRGLSTRAFNIDSWPQVMITAPLDGKLGGSHQYDYMVPNSMDNAPVRTLAFHPEGIASVAAVVDGGDQEFTLTKVDERLWQGNFDATSLDSGPHQLKVTATAADNSTSDHLITFYVLHDEDPVEPPVELGPESGPEGTPDIFSPTAESDYEVLSPDLASTEETVAPDPDSSESGEVASADTPGETKPGPPGVTGYIKTGGDDGCSAGTGRPVAIWLLVALLLGLWVVRQRDVGQC
jgi:hypothetical protein